MVPVGAADATVVCMGVELHPDSFGRSIGLVSAEGPIAHFAGIGFAI